MPAIRDEGLPAAPRLLGAEGLELAASVAAEGGGEVTSIAARQALYVPGRSLAVNYHAKIDWADREPTEQVVAAVAGHADLADGVPARSWGGGEVGAWRYPADPVLTGLEQALDERRREDLLGSLDLGERTVKLTPLVYRPLRRAVVRLSLGRRERFIFLKLVRPARAAQIKRVHDELDRHVPIPRCHGTRTEIGLLALEGLPGSTLRDHIRLREEPPPPAEHLIEMLDALRGAAASADGPVRSMRHRVRSHERLLRAILPDQERRIGRLAGPLRTLPSDRLAVVHGDFYDSQILVDDEGAISGMLDLDGVGWGNPADDLASMLGRVWTSGQTGGKGRQRFAAYAGELLDGFSRRVERRDLCTRAAAIVFGRATAPFRAQAEDWREQALERIDLAERCLASARRGELPG